MFTPTKSQDHQDTFKHKPQCRRDNLNRLTGFVLANHAKRQAAEQIQKEWEGRHKVDSLQARRDGLREQLEGLDECHQAELEHQQDDISRLKDAGLDIDPEEMAALDRLKSEQQEDYDSVQQVEQRFDAFIYLVREGSITQELLVQLRCNCCRE